MYHTPGDKIRNRQKIRPHVTSPIPKRWGEPPASLYQTRVRNFNVVKYPGCYGAGTIEVQKWIQQKLDEDADKRDVYHKKLVSRINKDEKVFPKKYRTKFVAIAKGTQAKNTLGFWMNGHYTVIVDKYGRNKLEIRQTLHIENGLGDNFYYMQYV